LVAKESGHYFGPMRVACESDKEIKSVIMIGKCNCILKVLVHVLRATYIQQWEDDTMADVMWSDIRFTMSDSIFESAV
jgi:hypothetical protein